MRWGLVLLIVASIIACSDTSQKQPQEVIGPGVQHNMGDLAAMMDELHLLMFEGPFTAKQSTEISNMMLRVSIMIKEMSGPDRERLASQHKEELKEMRRRVKIIREQLKKQN